MAVPRAGSAGTARASAGARSMGDWLKVSMSKIGLAPLTLDGIPKRAAKPSPLDDAEDSKPYALEKPDRRDAHRHDARPANAVVVAWKHEMGLIGRVFRWMNESAYLVSIPFVIILLFGIVVKTRPIALFGATFVVLLNIGRIAAGVANLAVVPLRDGLNLRKLKKPVRRVIEPVVWIGGVVLAFTFIPWLSRDRSGAGASPSAFGPRLDRSKRRLQVKSVTWPERRRTLTSTSSARRRSAISKGWSTRPRRS